MDKQNARGLEKQPHVAKFKLGSLGNGWTTEKSKGLHQHYNNLSKLNHNARQKLTRFVDLHGARLFSEKVNSQGQTRKQLLSNREMNTNTRKILTTHAQNIGIL